MLFLFKVAAIVDKGLYKSNNEDRILINNRVYDEVQLMDELSVSNILLAVADGVGGENAGEVAADETLKEMVRHYSLIDADYKKGLDEVIRKCFMRLLEIALSRSECEGMATTLTGLFMRQNLVVTFNLGNSRVCRYRNGMLRQLTHDHSGIQEMVDTGMVSRDNLKDVSERNVITKYIGSNGKIFHADIIKHDITMQAGDVFCLYSDGIHDYVSESEIESILNKKEILINKAREITDIAKLKLNHDNISIVLLEVL